METQVEQTSSVESPPAVERAGLVAEYTISRNRALLLGMVIGIAIGFANTLIDVDFSLRPELFVCLAVALPTVLFLHEGTHGLAGLLLGHRPVFGMQPPLFYTTFTERIARGRLIVIALAPLLALDILFMGLFAAGVLRLFAVLCLAINTIGAVGDLWIVTKLIRHERGTWIQDTKTGIAVWDSPTPR